MLERYNFTPFIAEMHIVPDQDGRDCLVTLLKATWSFSGNGEITIPERDAMRPIVLVDEYYEGADNSSVRYPTDLVIGKPGTDVVINGHVYGQGREVVDAGFELGRLRKIVRGFGPRQWQRDGATMKPGRPAGFDRIPLRYESAYGGTHEATADSLDSYEPNPIGIGYARTNALAKAMPHLEYPDQPLRLVSDRPPPASLGALPPHWPQRYRYAGTYDEQWERRRRPLPPADFDLRFNNCVPPDQVCVEKLRGGETLILHNLHTSEKRLSLPVPPLGFEVTARINDVKHIKPMEADTVLVEPDENRFSITLRAVFPVNNQHLKIKSVHFMRKRN